MEIKAPPVPQHSTGAIVRVPVKSSAIASVGYNPHTRVMEVEMQPSAPGKAGKVYSYPGVSEADHAEFMAAPSMGKHLASKIRPKYSTAASRV